MYLVTANGKPVLCTTIHETAVEFEEYLRNVLDSDCIIKRTTPRIVFYAENIPQPHIMKSANGLISMTFRNGNSDE